ncbi:hypothetical protein NPS46_04815 [Pseudomonas putida]|uniref:hypothetical protein n=1 Tax=Pseudomonas putida TaxID=303 RepID=UPI0023640907|nr:hypothetical protein [Pseudomonas putida]MDD2051872.1 hypothetical protein [Pseudomonas putida]
MKSLMFALLLVSPLALAKPASGSGMQLVEACQELVTIYEKHDEQKTLAGWRTSVSEALQAGYCRGVVIEYRRARAEAPGNVAACKTQDWFEQAQAISIFAQVFSQTHTVGELLDQSCGA